MDFIQGEKFINLANGVNIFYSHTHEVMDYLIPTGRFVMITHNSDMNLNTSFVPDNCVKWYSQNVNTHHPKIESIPIGLENNQWFPEVRKREKMITKLSTNKSIKNLLYINHNIGTNVKQRHEPYELFESKSWVTAERGSNRIGQFDSYLNNIYSHLFMICPEGNGMDTHRTWECLYMNTIPIEKRNLNNRFYTDLPICFVDEWSEITERFLNDEYDRITSETWNMEKLTFEYWKNKINESILHASEVSD